MHVYATVLIFLSVAAISFERTLLGVILGAAAYFFGWH